MRSLKTWPCLFSTHLILPLSLSVNRVLCLCATKFDVNMLTCYRKDTEASYHFFIWSEYAQLYENEQKELYILQSRLLFGTSAVLIFDVLGIGSSNQYSQIVTKYTKKYLKCIIMRNSPLVRINVNHAELYKILHTPDLKIALP